MTRQDPQGPRDFYAPPAAEAPVPAPTPAAQRWVTLSALLYLASGAGVFLAFGWGVVADAPAATFALVSALVLTTFALGVLLTLTAFWLQREKGKPRYALFVLVVGLLSGGLLALATLGGRSRIPEGPRR